MRIEDDVEVGACTCIDRATLGETVIGRGSKIDNLVQIAHNVKLGPLSLLCAQAGVSGSAEMGTGVVLAGQVGVVGHIRRGRHGQGGRAVRRRPRRGGRAGGLRQPGRPPPTSGSRTQRARQLADLLKEVRALRKRLAALENKETSR